MPPKKKEEPKEKPILGRFRTNLKVGAAAVGASSSGSDSDCSRGLGSSRELAATATTAAGH